MDLQEFNISWRSKQPNDEPGKDEPMKREPSIKQEEDCDVSVLSSFPKHMKKQAEALLNFLKSKSIGLNGLKEEM